MHANKNRFYSTRYFIKTNDREAFFCSNLKWVMASKKGTIKCMQKQAVLVHIRATTGIFGFKDQFLVT